MKFKEENWQPTIGDKFILVVSRENALVIPRADANNIDKILSGKGFLSPEYITKVLSSVPLTFATVGVQSSCRRIHNELFRGGIKLWGSKKKVGYQQ